MDSQTFAYHPPTPEQKAALADVQASYNATLAVVEKYVQRGRYLEAAIIELEKSGAMAAKGIFKNADGSARFSP